MRLLYKNRLLNDLVAMEFWLTKASKVAASSVERQTFSDFASYCNSALNELKRNEPAEPKIHKTRLFTTAFRYGFSAVDVIQFDAGVQVVQTLKKAIRDVTVLGRGGTSFQEPIEYAHENGYDGLVILTDGYAPEPVIPDNMRCKIVWVCNDRENYENSHRWMEKSGRVCVMELK